MARDAACLPETLKLVVPAAPRGMRAAVRRGLFEEKETICVRRVSSIRGCPHGSNA